MSFKIISPRLPAGPGSGSVDPAALTAAVDASVDARAPAIVGAVNKSTGYQATAWATVKGVIDAETGLGLTAALPA